MDLKKPCILEFQKMTDERGNLTFIEGNIHIPFEIKRIYYIYDVPFGAERAAHGHKDLSQIMLAVSGNFNVVLNDGETEHSYQLNNPSQGLYIPPMMWRDLRDFSQNAVCLVLASDLYNAADYYTNIEEFTAEVRNLKK